MNETSLGPNIDHQDPLLDGHASGALIVHPDDLVLSDIQMLPPQKCLTETQRMLYHHLYGDLLVGFQCQRNKSDFWIWCISGKGQISEGDGCLPSIRVSQKVRIEGSLLLVSPCLPRGFVWYSERDASK